MKIKKKTVEKPKKKQASDEASLSQPWTIRGVPMEARIAAQMAAKQNNEFVGSWVGRKLIKASQEDLTAKKEVARPEDIQDVLVTLSQEVQKLNQKIDQLPQKKTLFGFFKKQKGSV